MKLTLDKFGGITPRLSPHLLPPNGATVAHDVKLRNGRLEPWRELCEFLPASGSASFHVHGCCATSWDAVVSAAEVSPDWGRYYISGRNSYLEAVAMSCKCEPSYFRLGVPAPAPAPIVNGTESCGRDTDARSYVYTYINQWYEESAPSPASKVIRVADGSAVTVSGIALPDDGYGIIGANIYRSVSGFRDVKGKQQDKMTEFLYVATITFPQASYVDKVLMVNLGQALETECVRTPPEGLQNICSIESTVQLAATKKNRVYRSERFQPHNWPVKLELTLDSTIVHMVENDGRLFVSTDTVPYVIDATNCDDTKCTPVTSLDYPLPDISCGHQGSAISTPYGMVYSSPLGVVLVGGNAKWHLLTHQWFSRDDWAKVAPDTARFGFYEGFLFIVTDKVSFILDIDGKPYGDLEGTELATISDKPAAMEASSSGQLMLLSGGKIWNWNGADRYRKFTWKSRELTIGNGGSGQPLAQLWSPSSVKVRSEDVRFTLVDRHDRDVFSRKSLGERPFRVPRSGRSTHWFVRLEGTRPVDFVDIGTSELTVNSGA